MATAQPLSQQSPPLLPRPQNLGVPLPRPFPMHLQPHRLSTGMQQDPVIISSYSNSVPGQEAHHMVAAAAQPVGDQQENEEEDEELNSENCDTDDAEDEDDHGHLDRTMTGSITSDSDDESMGVGNIPAEWHDAGDGDEQHEPDSPVSFIGDRPFRYTINSSGWRAYTNQLPRDRPAPAFEAESSHANHPQIAADEDIEMEEQDNGHVSPHLPVVGPSHRLPAVTGAIEENRMGSQPNVHLSRSLSVASPLSSPRAPDPILSPWSVHHIDQLDDRDPSVILDEMEQELEADFAKLDQEVAELSQGLVAETEKITEIQRQIDERRARVAQTVEFARHVGKLRARLRNLNDELLGE
ncbi:uncharacterized protein DSM5745_00762 [Aspergillus mulundensis]|uniref:Uncharacterized protein n=1 Tax=Aspergillus mulundensis TaxID=1810919 RepID=A0A3D8T4H8_9EURO|nr:hypothetical protein DSM5745_00762 [Aspergillus mulundensis]RDW93440.1 hypothetical protein DSM5745_00762 [Aspergillus mulundensis]